jgi:hypothetical protein
MTARLANFPTLAMSSGKLLEEFPRPQQAAKREGVSLDEYRKEQAAKVMMAQVGAAEGLPSGDASDSSGAANTPAQGMAPQDDASGDAAAAAPAGKKGKNAKGQGGFGSDMTDYGRLQMQTPQRIVAELSMAKIDRAVYSERQLYEQMVDFWFNHFNVFAGKGAGPLAAHLVRARRDSPARHGEVPRLAGSHGERARRCSFTWITGRAWIPTAWARCRRKSSCAAQVIERLWRAGHSDATLWGKWPANAQRQRGPKEIRNAG